MTPKEALRGMCDLSKVKYDDYRLWVELKGTVEHALNELEIIKSYPTVDEVCEALSEYLGYNVIYGTHYTFVGENEICWFENGRVVFNIYDLPPHLITLIGRFYEGMEKGEGE